MLEPRQHQERRLVTVLFADFAGFTELADRMDPEELQVLVSGIFEDLAEEAVRHDGTIEKFIGDAIFVVFGAPVAHEDDPQRTLRTALAMQRVFADHAARVKKERGIEFGLRIGVHTGMVVAGDVRGVAEYGVMGDTVNVASRLQSVAGPGEIYVTQTTFRLTNREFTFREVGPVELKGKEKPILTYALVGERTDVRPSLEIAAPLVGRWMELSRLDLAYQSARLGRTEVVLISGEPGIGKSRLASEFIGLATAAEDGAKAADAPRVMRWTFSRVNQRSYAGFIEPLLVELNVLPTAPDGVTVVGEKLRELGFADPLRVAPTLAQFLHLPGVSEPASDSEEWKRSMYIVVYDVVAALARKHPVLYVLEDLHFADSASLDLLWFLASRASRVPILFLLAQRVGPGSPEPKPSRTNFTQLVLEPLSDEEAARIVEATLDWIPDELRDRIVARAGGNPFFIEESLRALVESGAVEKDDTGEWRVRERPGALEVPATLHAVVASRIDRLPPTARECIQLAAVIGQRFGDRVLRAAGGDRIADAVDSLIAADLVLEAAPGERREGRYRFKHAVVQEVAYNTLLVRRRVELHRGVAAAYEEVLGDELKEFYPALAHHYLLGDVPDRAAEYSWKSAQRATAIHAYMEALRFAEQSLELNEKLGRIEPAVEALYLIARVRRYRGENDAALAAYERALPLIEERDPNSRAVAILLAHMAELCTRWDAKHPDLEGIIARGLAIVGTERSRERVLLLAAKSFMPRRTAKPTDSDWQQALATAQEALAIAEELGLLRERSLCLDAVGFAYRELGNFREAYAANQRRLPIARSLQDSDELVDALTMVAISAMALGDLRGALDAAAEAREIAIDTEKLRLGAHALNTEALAHLVAGEFAAVLATVAQRTRLPASTKWAMTLGVGMAAAAAMSSPEEKRLRDELVEAEGSPLELAAADFLAAYYGLRESESAYHAVRSAGYPKTLVDLGLVGPLLVLAAARWRIADEAFEDRVAAVVERTDQARGRALLTQAEGIRAMNAAEPTKAAKLLFDAVQAFGTLRLDYERAVALADLARVLHGVPGRDEQAQASCDEAKAIAERLGATALRVAAENLTVRV
ncbi:MAG TPA: adenylate/guanylate cyclase domain-containing protein [Candidatus Limnocylindria bacterium]|nr:adenylate/guanylate cyclase domain-containing protein [Candidatus Limnocylindria bacterium]